MQMMTAQEIYDQVKTHLLTQNVKSTRKRDHAPMNSSQLMCAYRGDNGTKCAIGGLFTDEEYDPKMEGNSVVALNRNGMLPVRFAPHLNLELMQELQAVHDSSDDPKFWHQKLKEVARRFHLTP